MTTVEFHSPSGRMRLVVEGRHLLDQNDVEWLKYIGNRPGLINDRIAVESQKTNTDAAMPHGGKDDADKTTA